MFHYVAAMQSDRLSASCVSDNDTGAPTVERARAKGVLG
jgi:hypothetical protein